MSVLDEIRKLDEQKAKLLNAAKQEALDQANKAIATLKELGYSYRLVQDGETGRSGGGRRTGIREQVLSFITHNPGATRASLLELMGSKGDKSAEQSLSNALSALKKAGSITTANGGGYEVKR